MRIRQIKYTSSMSKIIGNKNSRPQSLYEQSNITTSGMAQSSHLGIHLNGQRDCKRPMLIVQCPNLLNVESIEDKSGIKEKQDFLVNRVRGIRLQKIKTQGRNSYKESTVDKENVTEVFRVKQKSFSKGFESYSRLQLQKPLERERIGYSKLPLALKINVAQVKKYELTSEVSNQTDEKDGIIFGQNLTYNVQSLSKTLEEIVSQAQKEEIKITEMRKELTEFRSKIQEQLQMTFLEIRKGIQLLRDTLIHNNAQKCHIMMSWKSVLHQKTQQYQEEVETIQEIEFHVEKVIDRIDGINGRQDRSEIVNKL